MATSFLFGYLFIDNTWNPQYKETLVLVTHYKTHTCKSTRRMSEPPCTSNLEIWEVIDVKQGCPPDLPLWS